MYQEENSCFPKVWWRPRSILSVTGGFLALLYSVNWLALSLFWARVSLHYWMLGPHLVVFRIYFWVCAQEWAPDELGGDYKCFLKICFGSAAVLRGLRGLSWKYLANTKSVWELVILCCSVFTMWCCGCMWCWGSCDWTQGPVCTRHAPKPLSYWYPYYISMFKFSFLWF